MNPNTVTIGPVRLSYLHLDEPVAFKGGEPKYCAAILLPKSDTKSYAAIQAAIADAKAFGVKARWGGRLPNSLDISVRDGDGKRPKGGDYGEECKFHWVITAKNKKQPILVDRNKQRLLDIDELYSGCYAYVNLTFYPYAGANSGIACNLNQILKFMDGERLGGAAVSVDEAFADVPAAAPSGGFDPISGKPL